MTPETRANFECLRLTGDFCEDPGPEPPADPFNEDAVTISSASSAGGNVTVSGNIALASGNNSASAHVYAPGFQFRDTCVGSFIGSAPINGSGDFTFSAPASGSDVCVRSSNNGSAASGM